jgi:hypothetical protein
MTARTATYMGLRVTRYGPRTTSVFGGSIGAGVPRPSIANRHTHHRYKDTPNDRIGTAAAQTTGGGDSHDAARARPYGTYPAIVPGITTVKIAVLLNTHALCPTAVTVVPKSLESRKESSHLAQHVGLVADVHEVPRIRQIDNPDGTLRSAQLRRPSVDERLPRASILINRRLLIRGRRAKRHFAGVEGKNRHANA